MKSFLEPAREIVGHLLEDEPDDMLKDVSVHGEEGFWEQIDGDYGDPWTYGGSWFNPVKGWVLHFEGIENDKDTEPEDVEVPDSTLAKVRARVHDPYLDTDEGKEDPAWLKRQLDSEEREQDMLLDQYRVARAEFLNVRKQRDFWLIDVPDELPSWLQRYEDAVRQALGTDAGYDYWPLAQKMVEIGRYTGYHELGSPLKMSKREAEAYLHLSL